MTDVQVSNARRIGFTALALIAFWVLAWQVYWIGTDYETRTIWSSIDELYVLLYPLRHPLVGLLFAFVPLMFLSLSITNSLLCLKSRFVFWSALVVATCLGVTCWLGELDAAPFWARVGHLLLPRDRYYWAYVCDIHPVSWFLLLVPIILTTAFVIITSWRRAVRDAEVEVVSEAD